MILLVLFPKHDRQETGEQCPDNAHPHRYGHLIQLGFPTHDESENVECADYGERDHRYFCKRFHDSPPMVFTLPCIQNLRLRSREQPDNSLTVFV
jgi:hypothetical protein